MTGKYAPGDGYRSGTRAEARGDTFMSRYLGDDVLERVQRLRPIADGLGITIGQLALAWVLNEPNLASAIVGASRPDRWPRTPARPASSSTRRTLRAIDEAMA